MSRGGTWGKIMLKNMMSGFLPRHSCRHDKLYTSTNETFHRCQVLSHIMRMRVQLWERERESVFQKHLNPLKFESARIESGCEGHFGNYATKLRSGHMHQKKICNSMYKRCACLFFYKKLSFPDDVASREINRWESPIHIQILCRQWRCSQTLKIDH